MLNEAESWAVFVCECSSRYGLVSESVMLGMIANALSSELRLSDEIVVFLPVSWDRLGEIC